MRSYPQYIDGADVEAKRWLYIVRASAMLRDLDAAFNLKRALELGQSAEPTEDVVARCAVGSVDDSDRALTAARRAGRIFRNFPQETRSRIVLDFHEALAARADEMIDILTAEGHPRRLAQWEVSGMLRCCDEATVKWYESQLHQSFESGSRRLELTRRPDGVVCVSPPQNAAASNSTLAVMALMPGNAIVVKAPRSAPLGVMFLFRDLLMPVLEKHGAPPGTLNLICGPPAGAILRSWVSSPLVDNIMFFGDSRAGLKLGEECFRNGKKAILELAGNDGFVVWRDADLDAAARALEECFYGSSQICMVPKYAIVHPEVAGAFIELLLERVKKLIPGYPEDPEILLSPVLKVDGFFDFIAEARRAGGEVLCGDGRVDVHGEPDTRGMFCEPTVIRLDGLDRARNLSCVREETFFPLLPVVVPQPSAAHDDADADADADMLRDIIEFLNAGKYGLRNSIWTRDEQLARRFTEDVTNCGQLKINDSHIGFSSIIATHGGTGESGGPYGELNYVGLRTSHMQGITWGDGDPRPLDPLVESVPATAMG